MKNITLTIMAILIATIAAFAQPPSCEDVVHIKNNKDITSPNPIITCPPNPPVPPPAGPNDERVVFWVHGLGGDANAFGKAADASVYAENNTNGFFARKLQSSKVQYGEDNSLLGCTGDLRDNIDAAALTQIQLSDIADPNNNFIIAHSQGGMVSSALLYKDFYSQPMPEDQRFYGGLVTVCSPLQGARILNNTQTLFDISEEACRELSAGYKEELMENGAFKLIDFFALRTDLDDLVEGKVDDVCNFVREDFMPVLFAGQQVSTTNDYMVGAEQIDWFNNTPTPGIDRVAFYGVESQDNLIWKTMEHFVQNPNSSDYWDANFKYDKLWEGVVASKLRYEEKYNQRQFEMYVLQLDGYPCDTWWKWTFFPGLLDCTLHGNKYWSARDKRDAWKRGIDWFNNINTDYLWAIGAKEAQTSTSTQCECIDIHSEPFEDVSFNGPCPPNPGGMHCTEYTATNITVLNKESDGVVLAESAKTQGQLTADPVRLKDTSHMQARNNKALKEALTDLYNGANGMFFYTEER